MSNKRLTQLQKNILDCLNEGMSTKEIVEQLNCAKSTVKRVRANIELKTTHEELRTNSAHDVVLSIIPTALAELEAILKNSAVRAEDKIAASKQLIELTKLTKEITPQEDIKIEVVYI